MYPTPQPPEYEQYQQYQPAGTEAVTDIAEQIIDERISKLKKEVEGLSQFKTEADAKIKNIDERLEKIEEVIEKLQASILSKIGTYGQNIESINKEMQMMQDSFSKALGPLISKSREKTGKTVKRKPLRKSGDGFEHYLR